MLVKLMMHVDLENLGKIQVEASGETLTVDQIVNRNGALISKGFLQNFYDEIMKMKESDSKKANDIYDKVLEQLAVQQYGLDVILNNGRQPYYGSDTNASH